MRRAMIVGNTTLPPPEVLDPWLRRADLVVAADGGANRLLARNVLPDAVVGDLDSLLGSARRRLKGRIHPRRGATRTDLEKAIVFAAEKGAKDITVAGASQGRLDHVLGAVSVLLEWSERLRIRFVDEDFTTELVRRRLRFRAPKGTLVSLFALDGARGVTTKGLRWTLRNATLRRGTLGIHNHVVANPVEISLKTGALLLLRGHRIEPHRG